MLDAGKRREFFRQPVVEGAAQIVGGVIFAAEGDGAGQEAGRVPAVVAGELALEVRGGGVLREGAEPLGAVGAVELDGGASGDGALC